MSFGASVAYLKTLLILSSTECLPL